MNPEFLKLGNFVIYWYGVMIALGVLISSLIFQALAKKENYTPDFLSQIIFYSVLWGIIGGRVLHVVAHFTYYHRNLLEILSIRNGGLAVEGAILSAFIFLYLYSKAKNFNLHKILDLISIPVPLAQALGRVGCFLNGCCWGKPTEVPWAVKFPYLPTNVHPTQLYYAISHIILFILLLILHKKKQKEGVVFSVYLMCFALIRYFLDKLRGDLLETYSGLYPTQIIAVFIFALGALWFISSTKLYQEFEGQEKTSSSDNLLPDEKEDENEDSHIEDPLSQ